MIIHRSVRRSPYGTKRVARPVDPPTPREPYPMHDKIYCARARLHAQLIYRPAVAAACNGGAYERFVGGRCGAAALLGACQRGRSRSRGALLRTQLRVVSVCRPVLRRSGGVTGGGCEARGGARLRAGGLRRGQARAARRAASLRGRAVDVT